MEIERHFILELIVPSLRLAYVDNAMDKVLHIPSMRARPDHSQVKFKGIARTQCQRLSPFGASESHRKASLRKADRLESAQSE